MAQSSKKRFLSVQKMSTIAVLAAVSSILFMVEVVPVPAVPFYKLDFSNLPVLLGTFAMGPLAGTLILAIKSFIGLLHSSSQGVGELADFLMGFAMVLPVGLVYNRNRSRKGAIWGMAAGALTATVTSVLANLYIMIPFFMMVYHMPVEAILGMGQAVIPSIDSLWKFVLYITAPFNLFKWVLISFLGSLMYKPLSPLLHGQFGRRKAKEKKRS